MGLHVTAAKFDQPSSMVHSHLSCLASDVRVCGALRQLNKHWPLKLVKLGVSWAQSLLTMATAYIALLLLLCFFTAVNDCAGTLSTATKDKRKEKKRKEKTMPFGVNLMRSQVVYRAAQEDKRNGLMQWFYMHSLPWHALRAVQPCMSAIVYCTIGCCQQMLHKTACASSVSCSTPQRKTALLH